MDNKPKGDAKDLRPKDKSLEAYKEWIREISERLTTNKEGINMTEQEWVKSWQEYWKERSKR